MKVTKHGIILKPTKQPFEKLAVLNPGVYQDGKTIHIFYRAIDAKHRSTIGYAKLNGPTKVVERLKKPIINYGRGYEKMGVEDPRIVKINDTYYMTYVAHDGKNAITSYATSKDLVTFKKRGVISPLIQYKQAEKFFSHNTERLKDSYYLFSAYYQLQGGRDILIWEKDFILFPRLLNKKFALLHRVLPDIQIVTFKNFKELTTAFWTKELKNLSKNVVLESSHWFETRNIGGGCPPIETDKGWLFIFHTVEERNVGRVYHASAALLDKKDPRKVLARLHQPLFSPKKEWERGGYVNNVVFPTGTAIFGKTLYIYYGAADSSIGVASVNIDSLIKAMKKNKHHHRINAKRK